MTAEFVRSPPQHSVQDSWQYWGWRKVKPSWFSVNATVFILNWVWTKAMCRSQWQVSCVYHTFFGTRPCSMHSSMAVERSCYSKARLCTGSQKFIRNASWCAFIHWIQCTSQHVMKTSESVHQKVVNGIVCYMMFVEHRSIESHNVPTNLKQW